MRGDQLARQLRIIRAIEANPNGLTVTEIAQRKETGMCMIYRDLKALQAVGFHPCPENDDFPLIFFKPKIHHLLALTELIFLYLFLVSPVAHYPRILRPVNLMGRSDLCGLKYL